MVENRPYLNILTHLVLIAGVLVVAFPVYVAFIASTHESSAFVRGVLPLLPGENMWASYKQMLGSGWQVGGTPPVLLMLGNSLI
ncbi:MAG: glycerol-3-phosphate transporter, partial [Halomonas sp.]